MAAITDRASHLADQEYDDYLDRLDGMGRVGYDATGKQAAITADIGDLGYQYGTAKAGIRQNGMGLGVATLADTGRGIAESLNQGMKAGQEAAGNRFSAIMGGLDLAAKLAGSAMGGGSFSKFLG
jgi:hypothetical protein